MEKLIQLKRGQTELPYSEEISGKIDSALTIVATSDLDVDVAGAIQWAIEDAKTVLFPLKDSAGDDVTLPVTASAKKNFAMIKDINARFIKVAFSYTGTATKASAASPGSSDITDTEATLAGTVNPKSSATNVIFQIGTTDAYGTDIPVETAIAKDASETAVTVTVEDLLPETEYHWRIKMINSIGISYSTDQEFTTLATSEE